ncbi:Predicted kinase, aminoglycoside phosphotransferase (APT) family [Virgibacillus subterraneus]|uniref:Predicted kinase, aminoglycoside phosphotransferase (APT) family n=1 Tax=Virgibacillus subterraneus TaxID=621109 RepID=A0A1H9JUL0_9BACI|nr:aminoglycoside phosphotransferase family protein [Virgibacillus subterraneus]SEQ90225.1 Predicted kinase, aminoglycoside phosphotransferase (APT) family [Virgibacillus subterraneus]
MVNLEEKISYLKNAKAIVELNKGFSHDKKYVVDNKYLIRIFPIKDQESRKIEFNTLNKLAGFSNYVPKGFEFESLINEGIAYMVLDYLPGADAEVILKYLTEQEQYAAGFHAGEELSKLHQFSAPVNYPSWYSVKREKNNRYLEQLKEINLDENIMEMLTIYIEKNEYLLKDRPNTFQHDDFHPANLLIQGKTFSGIIDFQRMDWGDPIHDLHKLGFFSKRISIAFTRGIIDGYRTNTGINESFWQLYALYSAMHIVSALVWGKKLGSENYERMLAYSLDVIEDHDHFRQCIPNWYK